MVFPEGNGSLFASECYKVNTCLYTGHKLFNTARERGVFPQLLLCTEASKDIAVICEVQKKYFQVNQSEARPLFLCIQLNKDMKLGRLVHERNEKSYVNSPGWRWKETTVEARIRNKITNGNDISVDPTKRFLKRQVSLNSAL